MEEHLYLTLKKYNETIPNEYREGWGSALSYLDPSSNVLGKEFDEVEVQR